MSEYEMAKLDLDKYKMKVANLPSSIPTNVQRLPTKEEENQFLKLILYNGLWLIITYGASALSMVSPLFGKAFGALVSWKFNANQKDVPDVIKDLKK